MLCCTRNSGDPETTLQSLERIDDGSTRLGHAASILWASADGQDPAATSCTGLNRTECRCLSHSVRGRRVWRMLPPHGGRKAEYASHPANERSLMPRHAGGRCPRHGCHYSKRRFPTWACLQKGPADAFWKRWLPPRDEGLVGPWHRVQVMRARDGFCDGERDAGSGGDTRRSSTYFHHEGRGVVLNGDPPHGTWG